MGSSEKEITREESSKKLQSFGYGRALSNESGGRNRDYTGKVLSVLLTKGYKMKINYY